MKKREIETGFEEECRTKSRRRRNRRRLCRRRRGGERKSYCRGCFHVPGRRQTRRREGGGTVAARGRCHRCLGSRWSKPPLMEFVAALSSFCSLRVVTGAAAALFLVFFLEQRLSCEIRVLRVLLRNQVAIKDCGGVPLVQRRDGRADHGCLPPRVVKMFVGIVVIYRAAHGCGSWWCTGHQVGIEVVSAHQVGIEMMIIRAPGTPASKIDRTPVSTPGGPRDRGEDCSYYKVFGPAFLTEAVYEEGVKNVALSALMGINATIFAYGQTSSGKTYTMRGITEKAVNDIYKHIMNVNKVKYLFRTMTQGGVSPDIWSYNIMIHGLCKSEMVNQAFELFHIMCSKNLVHDEVTFSILIDGLGKSRRIDEAFELLQKMQDGGHPADLVTFNILIDGL
ncbi:hypothetical protein Ahy_A05g022969 isoform C [Arachis hypogaea]|uniref:Kinesin motor domain-containing protein n=1 Tax=Arachis hypogaea TaxID=3818 RepID=A0A445D2G0_ARAHY|nr:hypothetical protein Ahy_A05g022969 isoform C [Arachis hypogaea]